METQQDCVLRSGGRSASLGKQGEAGKGRMKRLKERPERRVLFQLAHSAAQRHMVVCGGDTRWRKLPTQMHRAYVGGLGVPSCLQTAWLILATIRVPSMAGQAVSFQAESDVAAIHHRGSTRLSASFTYPITSFRAFPSVSSCGPLLVPLRSNHSTAHPFFFFFLFFCVAFTLLESLRVFRLYSTPEDLLFSHLAPYGPPKSLLQC